MIDLFPHFNRANLYRNDQCYGCNIDGMNTHIGSVGSGKAAMVMISFFLEGWGVERASV